MFVKLNKSPTESTFFNSQWLDSNTFLAHFELFTVKAIFYEQTMNIIISFG